MNPPETSKARNGARILVVDDDPGVLRAVERILADTYDVSAHRSARDGLAAAGEFRPDIAVIDIRMPEMDGFTLQRELARVVPEIDVILMTGSMTETDELLIRALKENAFYFILKPFRREVLEALVRRCVEVRRLRASERRHIERMESELTAARALQQAMLAPTRETFGSIRVEAAHRACTELGGDFFDYFPLSDSSLALIVADVRGHGAPAALMTALVRNSFRSVSTRAFSPRAVIRQLVSSLAHFPSDRFVTAFCAVVDPRNRTLRYCNAGHPPAIAWTVPASLRYLDPSGPLASPMMKDEEWIEETVALMPGSYILVYTDGVIDQCGPEDRFGYERLVSLLSSLRLGQSVPEQIVDALDAFRAGRLLDDDVTLLGVEIE